MDIVKKNLCEEIDASREKFFILPISQETLPQNVPFWWVQWVQFLVALFIYESFSWKDTNYSHVISERDKVFERDISKYNQDDSNTYKIHMALDNKDRRWVELFFYRIAYVSTLYALR